MSTFATPQPASTVLRTFSLGGKFFLIMVLALVMSLSGLFVEGLTTERADNHGVRQASESTPAQPEKLFGVELADSYRAIHRSLHYITLFLGLVFLTYFLFEVMTGKGVHPAQYALVGVAQVIFYLLLLSFAERLGFDLSFFIAGGSTIALFSLNTYWLFQSRRLALRALAVFTLLYAFIYVLLRVEAYALLVGAVTSFFAVAVAMYLTRKVDCTGRAVRRRSLLRMAGSRGSTERSRQTEKPSVLVRGAEGKGIAKLTGLCWR